MRDVEVMRLLATAAILAVSLVASTAHADKAKTSAPVAPTSLTESLAFSARGDAELVGRASRVPSLPSTLDARDRAVVGRITALFRAGRVDAGRTELTAWIKNRGRRHSVDDVTAAVLWVTRETVASRRADLVAAASRVQEADGRVLVLEAALADLKVAATKRRDVYVAMPAAEDGSRRTERVSHDQLASRLAETEVLHAKAEADRASVREAFASLEGASRPTIAALVSCVRVAVEREKR